MHSVLRVFNQYVVNNYAYYVLRMCYMRDNGPLCRINLKPFPYATCTIEALNVYNNVMLEYVHDDKTPI